MGKAKLIKPFPFAVYFWTVMLLVVIGLADSIYLAISHYRVYTDITYSSFCALSKAINCDTVSQSPYSIFWQIPLPIWGIAGYIFFLLFLPLARSKDADKERVWALLFLLSLLFTLCSIILAVISSYYIRSYCIMCLVSYAVNLLLLFYTRMIRSRFSSQSMVGALKQDLHFLVDRRIYCISVFTPFLLCFILVKIFLPVYWSFQQPVLSAQISSGTTIDGHPWIGAKDPRLVITEYTDYQCFQCKKMHFFLRRLIAENPDKIRLVHRHFPMDHEFNPIVKIPFHVGAGKMALLAISAAAHDKFWQINDALFAAAGQGRNLNIKKLAQKAGMDYRQLARALTDPDCRRRLQNDIISGLQLQITGTPAFVIDQKVYLAQIPPQIIRNALKQR